MANYDVDPYDPDEWGPSQPTGDVRWRPTHLLREVVELYQAQSFLVWRYGTFFNTHITITPSLMGIVDHKYFASLMPRFNKELKRWLALGNDTSRRRWRKWLRQKVPQEHWYIYVLERALTNGLHAHELCVVPKSQMRAFEMVVREWWTKEAGFEIPKEAISIRHAKACYERHVQWFRYLIKSVNREATIIDANGLPRSVVEVFKPETYWETMPTYAPQLIGVCLSLGPKARRTPIPMGSQPLHFLSKLNRRDLDDVYDGWEIDAFEGRPGLRLLAAMES